MKLSKPLERILFDKDKIKKDQLKKIEEERLPDVETTIEYIIHNKLASESDISEVISEEIEVPFVDLENYIIDPSVLDAIDEKFARRFKVLPLYLVKDVVTVAMADPKNILEQDEIQSVCKYDKIQFCISTHSAINKAIDENYSHGSGLEDIMKSLEDNKVVYAPSSNVTAQRLTSLAEQPPIVRFVNQMIFEGVKSRASDIHIEKLQGETRIRYRIDGVLRTAMTIPGEMRLPIVPRIKILSELDITETRRPQDGRFSVSIAGRQIDLRVATFNTAFGENITLRLLDKSNALFDIEELGFSDNIQKSLKKFIKSAHGIALLTGPTGCGKTTTLYSLLNRISSPEVNILTIEDPIEYILDNVTQSQVNPKIDLDFASALRSFLRHDPDVIMVGEIRDNETADMAFRAAMTGHLVLSTLHTNDTPTAISRLRDLELDNNLIASTLICILAQRLVRVICPSCKEEYQPDESIFEELKIEPDAKVKYYKGKGCEDCNDTGYQGRIVISELLKFEEKIKSLITKNASIEDIRSTAQKDFGMVSLRDSGLEKVKEGLTTLDEILRVTND